MKTTAGTRDLNEVFRQFTGTEKYYRHFTKLCLFTDGVKAMAEKFGAYWLIDVAASWQLEQQSRPFQIWTIVSEGNKAVVTMKEDSGQPEIVRQEIAYTDFPEGRLKMYLTNRVLLLPSEY